jgi:hypothetical protein
MRYPLAREPGGIASAQMLTARLLRSPIVATMALAAASMVTFVDLPAGASNSQPNDSGPKQGTSRLATGSDRSSPIVTVTTAPPVPTSVPTGGNCGTFFLAGGWPTTTTIGTPATSCISAALRAGRSATLTEVAETDGRGGHPRVTTFRVTARNRLLVTINNTKAKPRGVIQKWRCTGLADQADELVATGCKRA